jgi:hypothetical protein
MYLLKNIKSLIKTISLISHFHLKIKIISVYASERKKKSCIFEFLAVFEKKLSQEAFL